MEFFTLRSSFRFGILFGRSPSPRGGGRSVFIQISFTTGIKHGGVLFRHHLGLVGLLGVALAKTGGALI